MTQKTSKFLGLTGKPPIAKAIKNGANTRRFPTILGDCCAEVVLENSKLVATTVFETDALA